jgi:seipin
VDLNLPDSEVNMRQGMFMIHLTLLDSNNQVIVSSSRPALMTHRSIPVKLIHTFFSWPFYLIGIKKEAEQLEVPLVEDYVDGIRSNKGPASSAKVVLVARDLQVYSSTLSIQANLTGLRHYMVNWPILTALFGVATIFAFLSLITICSINRVVRDDSADTEMIFPEDSMNSFESNNESLERHEEEERQQDPDSTVNDD